MKLAPHILETDASVVPGPCSSRTREPRSVLAGGGIVLRDPNLRLLAARSVTLGPIRSPTVAELAALAAGLEVALEFRVSDLRAWNDNLSLMRYFNGEGGLGSLAAASSSVALLS